MLFSPTPPRVAVPEGEGGGCWPKTTFEGIVNENSGLGNQSRPVLRPKTWGGAPLGNRNAWKHGSYCAAALARRKAFAARVAAWHARTRVLLEWAELAIARRAGNA